RAGPSRVFTTALHGLLLRSRALSYRREPWLRANGASGDAPPELREEHGPRSARELPGGALAFQDRARTAARHVRRQTRSRKRLAPLRRARDDGALPAPAVDVHSIFRDGVQGPARGKDPRSGLRARPSRDRGEASVAEAGGGRARPRPSPYRGRALGRQR